jgi:hypothetical protein
MPKQAPSQPAYNNLETILASCVPRTTVSLPKFARGIRFRSLAEFSGTDIGSLLSQSTRLIIQRKHKRLYYERDS